MGSVDSYQLQLSPLFHAPHLNARGRAEPARLKVRGEWRAAGHAESWTG